MILYKSFARGIKAHNGEHSDEDASKKTSVGAWGIETDGNIACPAPTPQNIPSNVLVV